MAVIKSFAPSIQAIRRHASEVECEYIVVDDEAGRVLHLSTFGSDTRASERKSSQSIQLDEARVVELLDIIARAFPGAKSGSQ